MTAHQIFRLRNPVLLMALLSAFPLLSHAAAANVDFAAGSVTAVNAAGFQRPLTKGAEIGNGDTISTGDSGRVQVRFSDGAMISLQPQTEFRVDNYQYSGQVDGQEKGFFSLIKGGLRTITGLVGRSNRDNYKVTTSVATIGIRGTEYNAIFDSINNALAVAAGEGLVEVCNGAGCMQLGAGEAGRVISGSAPQRSDTKPQLPPTAAGVPGSVLPVVLPRFPESGLLTGANTYSTVYAVDSWTCCGPTYIDHAVGPGVINPVGVLTDFTTSSGTTGANLSEPTNYAISLGNDGIVAWGAWITAGGGFSGALAGSEGYGYTGALHYVVGIPTTDSKAALGGASGTYSMIGPAIATIAGGGGGVITSASMTVDFLNSEVKKLDIGMSLSSGSYTLAAGTGNGWPSPITIGGFGTGAQFYTNAAYFFGGSGCGSGCAGEVKGAFFGAGAPRAGVAFQFTDAAKISGAVALKK